MKIALMLGYLLVSDYYGRLRSILDPLVLSASSLFGILLLPHPFLLSEVPHVDETIKIWAHWWFSSYQTKNYQGLSYFHSYCSHSLCHYLQSLFSHFHLPLLPVSDFIFWSSSFVLYLEISTLNILALISLFLQRSWVFLSSLIEKVGKVNYLN